MWYKRISLSQNEHSICAIIRLLSWPPKIGRVCTIVINCRRRSAWSKKKLVNLFIWLRFKMSYIFSKTRICMSPNRLHWNFPKTSYFSFGKMHHSRWEITVFPANMPFSRWSKTTTAWIGPRPSVPNYRRFFAEACSTWHTSIPYHCFAPQNANQSQHLYFFQLLRKNVFLFENRKSRFNTYPSHDTPVCNSCDLKKWRIYSISRKKSKIRIEVTPTLSKIITYSIVVWTLSNRQLNFRLYNYSLHAACPKDWNLADPLQLPCANKNS